MGADATIGVAKKAGKRAFLTPSARHVRKAFGGVPVTIRRMAGKWNKPVCGRSGT
jgi:hypothetical protein